MALSLLDAVWAAIRKALAIGEFTLRVFEDNRLPPLTLLFGGRAIQLANREAVPNRLRSGPTSASKVSIVPVLMHGALLRSTPKIRYCLSLRSAIGGGILALRFTRLRTAGSGFSATSTLLGTSSISLATSF